MNFGKTVGIVCGALAVLAGVLAMLFLRGPGFENRDNRVCLVRERKMPSVHPSNSGMREEIFRRNPVSSCRQEPSERMSKKRRGILQCKLNGDAHANAARLASDKNQVMDALLDQPQFPADYCATMIALYRDRSQDVVTRDFAVQHIGHYALALNRRRQYAADSAEARELRAALFDAASETHSIVAAAAFRALADMSEFDSSIDARRLDSLLVACAADAAAEPAARAMAIHLCGERRVASARPVLEFLAAAPDTPEVLRRSAAHSLLLISGQQQ